MTQTEFIYYASAKIEPGKGRIYIWYTETIPYTIQGLAVPVEDVNGISVLAYLQQVREITLPVAGDGAKILKITDQSLQRGNGIDFYFFLVEEQVILVTTPPVVANGAVVFSPGFLGLTFIGSDYNVLAGSIEKQQQSSYIFQSDRAALSTLGVSSSLGPLNLKALQAGTALKAYVQDSNYDDSGWIRARYEGSKTSKDNYGDLEPTIQGTAFQASYFSPSISGSTIASQSKADMVFKEYLYTGNTIEPVSESRIFNINKNKIEGVQNGTLLTQDSSRLLFIKYIPGSGSLVYSSSLI
jgi:hypothetical protein